MTDMLDAPASIPTEVVTPISPSEALRLGRLVYPNHNHDGEVFNGTTACAMGAMLAGWGYGPNDEDENYTLSEALLGQFGLSTDDVYTLYDLTSEMDGDGAVIEFLEEKGL